MVIVDGGIIISEEALFIYRKPRLNGASDRDSWRWILDMGAERRKIFVVPCDQSVYVILYTLTFLRNYASESCVRGGGNWSGVSDVLVSLAIRVISKEIPTENGRFRELVLTPA